MEAVMRFAGNKNPRRWGFSQLDGGWPAKGDVNGGNVYLAGWTRQMVIGTPCIDYVAT
jgi:hypothetical protein